MKPNQMRRTFQDVRLAEHVGQTQGPAAMAAKQMREETCRVKIARFVDDVLTVSLMECRNIKIGKIRAANIINWHVKEAVRSMEGKPARASKIAEAWEAL